MKYARALVLTGLALAAFACATAEPPPPASPVASVDARAPIPTPTPIPVEAGPAAFEPPPSGEYELTSEVASDTCPGPDGGIPTFTKRNVPVLVKINKGTTYAIFPLVVGALGGIVTPRSDVVLDPPPTETKPFVFKPQKACPSYEERVTTKPILVTPDHMRLSHVREYGDASTCSALPKVAASKCKRELVFDYKLVTKRCDARCVAEPLKDGGADMKCTCPDGGTP